MFPIRRTQTVTLRLDPKLRYLTDLAARSQRRTTSGFIEWAIEGSFSEVPVYSESGGVVLLADIDNYLWDVAESDRFLKLASAYPNLLGQTFAKPSLMNILTNTASRSFVKLMGTVDTWLI